MTTYVALLRGIMPTNSNMRGEKLTEVFESLGLKKVTTVIASGNVIFCSTSKDLSALETTIEKELYSQLGFFSTTIIRSYEELEQLVKKDPFKGVLNEKPNYLVVTFFKDRKAEICTTLDLNYNQTTNFMRLLEKEYGKEITTRSWKTVARILAKMRAKSPA